MTVGDRVAGGHTEAPCAGNDKADDEIAMANTAK
jgi:hypothetical protein